jgi:hypothetical protein
MNKQEYAEYEASVAEFFESEGLANLSIISEENSEPYFSWIPCDCCGRPEGGDRYDANGYNPTTKEVQDGYAICTDCMYYAEYGRLDDMTMYGIEDS